MSRTHRFLGGIGFGYANQILLILAGLWLTPFYLKRIGTHEFGLWLTGLQILSYLALIDFGITGLIPRETGFAIGRAGGNIGASDLQTMLQRTIKILAVQWPIAALIAVLVLFLLPEKWNDLRGPLAIVFGSFVLFFPARIFQGVLQGIQDLSFLGAIQMISWMISTTLIVVLVLSGFGLYSLALGAVSAQIISTILWWVRFRKKVPIVIQLKTKEDTGGYSDQLRKAYWVFIAQLAQVLLQGTDMIVLAAVMGPSAVVAYSCTAKLVQIFFNQPLLITQSAFPALSELRYSDSPERLVGISNALSQSVMLVSGLFATVVLVANQGFVRWWVGADFFVGLQFSVLLIVAMLVRHWNITAVYTIFCYGHERRISIATILDGAVTVAASYLLVGRIGLSGIPIGSIIGACLISLPLNLTAQLRETGQSWKILLSKQSGWFIRFLFLMTAAIVLSSYWVPPSFVAVMFVSLVCALLYSIFMLRTAIRSDAGPYLNATWNRLREMIRSVFWAASPKAET